MFGAAALLVLLTRPWWQHGAPRQPELICLTALPAAYALAIALWCGTDPIRLLAAVALLAAAALHPAGLTLATITLATLAALRRDHPAFLTEAYVAGASPFRLATSLLLKRAAPGLIYGALLTFTLPAPLALIAASLSLCFVLRE